MRSLVYLLLPPLAFLSIAPSLVSDVSLSSLYLSQSLCLVSYIISFPCQPSVYLLSLDHFSLPFQHVPIPLTLCIYNAFIDVSTLLVHCRHTLCCGLSCFLLLSAFSRSVTTRLRNVYSHEFSMLPPFTAFLASSDFSLYMSTQQGSRLLLHLPL